MKIEIGNDNKVRFFCIPIGDIFKSKSWYYLRIVETVTDNGIITANAVNLTSNQLVYINDHEDVQLVESKLIIKE